MLMMTKEAIRKLQKQTSHALIVEDFDVIAELDKCAQDVVRKSSIDRRLLSCPVTVDGVEASFYPLTVAKSIWYAEKLDEWEIAPIYEEAFMFWLLTLPNKEDELCKWSTKKNVNKAMRKFASKLVCPASALQEVFARCVGVCDSNGEKDNAEDDYGGMIACLVREYGGKPEEWLYEKHVELIAEMYERLVDRVQAEQDEMRKSSKSGGAPVVTRKMRALDKFRQKTSEIRMLWSEQDG